LGCGGSRGRGLRTETQSFVLGLDLSKFLADNRQALSPRLHRQAVLTELSFQGAKGVPGLEEVTNERSRYTSEIS
jgi:hypothetical protein